MNSFLVIVYFTSFAVIAGGAFALMWQNLQTLEWPEPKPRHPEAPAPGEEVMYVDVSSMSTNEFKEQKQALEDLFNE